MGRPIEKRFFGNLSAQSQNNLNSVGGEGVASVTNPAGTLAALVNGTYTIPAANISAPQIPGGAKPVLSVTVTGATAYTVTVVSSGSGYTSAPTITFNGSVAGGSGSATPVATMTTNRQNALAVSAYIPGGSSASAGDIIKQTNARSFLVRTADGVGDCVLTTGSVTAGKMSITATKADSSTFLVRKITGRKVYDSSGNSYNWTLGAASGSIVSLSSN